MILNGQYHTITHQIVLDCIDLYACDYYWRGFGLFCCFVLSGLGCGPFTFWKDKRYALIAYMSLLWIVVLCEWCFNDCSTFVNCWGFIIMKWVEMTVFSFFTTKALQILKFFVKDRQVLRGCGFFVWCCSKKLAQTFSVLFCLMQSFGINWWDLLDWYP